MLLTELTEECAELRIKAISRLCFANLPRGLRRELEEKLEFAGAECNEFTRFDFDLQRINGRKLYRIYYEVPVRSAALFRFVLHEGRDMRLFSPAEIFDRANLTPYDSFALWLHASRGRIR